MAKEKAEATRKTLFERNKTSGHWESEKFYYEIPHAITTEEVVDMDAFQPINEALKKLDGKRELTGDEVKQYYDFASGADNHGEIPYNRSAECQDIAMLSEHIANTQNDMRERISKTQAEAQEEAEIRARVSGNANQGTQTE